MTGEASGIAGISVIPAGRSMAFLQLHDTEDGATALVYFLAFSFVLMVGHHRSLTAGGVGGWETMVFISRRKGRVNNDRSSGSRVFGESDSQIRGIFGDEPMGVVHFY